MTQLQMRNVAKKQKNPRQPQRDRTNTNKHSTTKKLQTTTKKLRTTTKRHKANNKMTQNAYTGQSGWGSGGPSLISLPLRDYLALRIAVIYWFHIRIYTLIYNTEQNCNYCFIGARVLCPPPCIQKFTNPPLLSSVSDKMFKVRLVHFEKQHNSQKTRTPFCHLSDTDTIQYVRWCQLISSAGRSSHPTRCLTDWHPSILPPVSPVAAGHMGESSKFFKGKSVFAVTRGCFLFSFLFVHTNSLTPPLFFLSHPSLSWERELLLGCSWCKSPAQTAQACQQSAADSSNPSSQSSYPRPHYPRALAVGGSHKQTSTESALKHTESIFIMLRANRSHTSRSAGGEALMHTLFQLGFKRSPPW